MLDRDYNRFTRRLIIIEDCFVNYRPAIRRIGNDRYRHWHSLEGLLSSTWQAWSAFCRSVILSSSIGTTTRSGIVTLAQPTITGPERLAYVAKQLAQKKPVKDVGSLSLHQEPTWGDPNIIDSLVEYLNPANAKNLQTGVLFDTRAPSDIRLVRNAAAHFNNENMKQLDRIRVYYRSSSLFHPVDVLSWSTKDNKDFAFLAWIHELREMAFLMTE